MDYRSQSYVASTAIGYGFTASSRRYASDMRSTPVKDEQLRKRLIEAVDRLDKGSADAFGRRLGYTNGGYIREVINGKKPVREALIERAHAAEGLRGWFTPILGSRQAQSVSLPAPDDASIRSRTIEDAYRSGEGWFGEDGLQMLTPQEVELIGIFRQLGAPARKVTLEALRSTRDREEREAEALQMRLRKPATSGPARDP